LAISNPNFIDETNTGSLWDPLWAWPTLSSNSKLIAEWELEMVKMKCSSNEGAMIYNSSWIFMPHDVGFCLKQKHQSPGGLWFEILSLLHHIILVLTYPTKTSIQY
jgi:hypothetical protein